MIKKIFLFLLLLIPFSLNLIEASTAPSVNCIGLPGCLDDDMGNPKPVNIENNVAGDFMVGVVKEFIKYIAVIAVISVMISGIMYLVSGGEEEKINRAKKWIIWSLVGVILSISAWGIINFINQLSINN
ncbi:MAG: pilin [Candidatus Gracilibacteria bacterium]|nr:pilin [Candidatus Gracilibacteria bacterium]